MKVFQLIQTTQLRGAEVFAYQLSRHLQAQDCESILVVLFDNDEHFFQDMQPQFIRADKSKRLFDWKAWKKISELINDIKPDCIQANAGDTLKYAVFSKFFFRWKQPIIFRNANKMSDFVDSNHKYYFNKWLLRQTRHIVSVSEECRKDIISFFGIKPDKVTTATIGIETPIINSVPEDLKMIFDKGPVILHVASFVPEKNHHGLLRIFKKVKNKLPEVQLILIGKGKLENEIRTQIQSLDLADNVYIAGTRQDISIIMSASDVVVLPSLIEGLPGVLLEAMFAETPIIAYDTGGISEVIQDRSTGLLISKGHENSFAEAIIEIINNKNLYKTLKQQAKIFVLANYKNVDVAKKFKAIYQMILSE